MKVTAKRTEMEGVPALVLLFSDAEEPQVLGVVNAVARAVGEIGKVTARRQPKLGDQLSAVSAAISRAARPPAEPQKPPPPAQPPERHEIPEVEVFDNGGRDPGLGTPDQGGR